MRGSTRLFMFLVAWALFPAAAVAGDSATISPQQFREDLQAMRAQIAATHPQLDYTVDVARLDRALARTIAGVKKPLTPDEAWRRAAALNPLLADGHLSILVAEWRDGARRYLAAGGRLFPYEVSVSPAGDVTVLYTLGGGESTQRGAKIASINGVPATVVASELLGLVHGDTVAFRASLLSRRWWWYYWKRYGAPDEFTLGLAGTPREISVAASSTPPLALREARFEETYQLDVSTPGVAVLTVKSFYWEDKDRYYRFMADAFARIKRAGASTLVIDVRENGGGDDDMWIDGILKYIADKPYRTGSSYVKRVIAGHRGEGETVGEVKHGQIETINTPESGNPWFFHGKTYVLIGPYTYSSAILFANVVHDNGFATLAGTGGAARRGQTGGIQSFVHSATGLELVCPRFLLLPPSGGDGATLLEPQIRVDDPATDPGQAVRELVRRAS